jgi:hypothetical protein
MAGSPLFIPVVIKNPLETITYGLTSLAEEEIHFH